MTAIAWMRPAVALAVAAATTVAWAAELGKRDADFMRKAAENGMLEIQSSQLAQDKAENESVKSFAAQMVKDHQAADTELKSLASSKGVELPTELPTAEKKKLEALGALQGRSFDRQYAQEVGLKAHDKAVKLFREASNNAKDADVKGFASKTLPILEQHLDMARKMASEVGAGTGRGTGQR